MHQNPPLSPLGKGGGTILLIILTLFIGGCGQVVPTTVEETALPEIVEQPLFDEILLNTWQSVGDQMARMEYLDPAFETRVILYRFPTGLTWRLAQATEPKTISEWAEEESEAVLIINGFYFHEDYLPSGLLISNGDQIGTREFDMDRSGFIELSPELRIIDTSKAQIDRDLVIEGAQSYPFLLQDGKPVIESASDQVARRSFVGLDRAGHPYLGIVPDSLISLFGLANVISKIDIDWAEVINLDGGNSTGLSASFSEYKELIEGFAAVPNVIIVESGP